LREAIVVTARAMNTTGINRGTAGNVSARTSGGFLITPSAVPYDVTTADHVVAVSDSGEPTGALAPSTEWRFHREIYRNRPDLHAIVHTHSPFATTVACLGRRIPAFHYKVAIAGGNDIRCAPYATFGTQELGTQGLPDVAPRDDRGRCDVVAGACARNRSRNIGGDVLARAADRRAKRFERFRDEPCPEQIRRIWQNGLRLSAGRLCPGHDKGIVVA
jgi:Class II Aldolase and Adducin N-terminal domain